MTQSYKSQEYEINRYCVAHKMEVHKWVTESTSGTVAVEKRSLGRIIRKMSKGISIHTIKDDFDFSDNINSKTIAFDFVPSAETERNLISQRTDEALAVKKIAGVKSGRRGGRLRKGI